MTAYLLIAHGSRRAAANIEFQQQVEQVRQSLQLEPKQIQGCYLELCEPSIQQGLEILATQGAQQIKVLPCFLNQGRHVAEDVPRDVREFMDANPELRIEILPYLGSTQGYLQLVSSCLKQH